ncbi:MAG TPA: cyclodeaminase/cyclohydrolase family protein [Thermoleophilaceae bacterium]|nr:cyclodeaminase/cyclohydrolase family protein [Thermoleophilaceae bacterium]
MTGLSDQPLGALLDDVAAARPAPGGGSSTALATALAAALAEMVAHLEGVPDLPDRARSLRLRALALADRELSAYLPVLEARRLPADDPARAATLEAALRDASRTPLAIAEAAAETAELATQAVLAAGPAVRGDALTGALLAEAATAAAASLVEINLRDRPDDPAIERAGAARRRAREARQAAAGTP